MFELVKRSMPKDWPVYWILSFPFYGKFVFYGTEPEAEEMFERYSKHEGAGLLRKANPKVEEDLNLVREEIDAVLEDRRYGVPGLPYLPREGGF